MSKANNKEGPTIELTQEPLGDWFRLTNLNLPSYELTEPIDPVFIEKIDSGQVRVWDDYTRIQVSGPFKKALINYRTQLIVTKSENPQTLPQIKRRLRT